MTYEEIATAVTDLPDDQKLLLFRLLVQQLPTGTLTPLPRGKHGVKDIPAVHLGGILQPLSNEDDLLGEMLENRQ